MITSIMKSLHETVFLLAFVYIVISSAIPAKEEHEPHIKRVHEKVSSPHEHTIN